MDAYSQAFKNPGFIARHGLGAHNALDYFYTSPFYDKSSNNELLRIQSASVDSLRALKGLEYGLVGDDADVIACAPRLFLIVEGMRISPQSTKAIAYYYILDTIVYKVADVKTLLLTRVRDASEALELSLDVFWDSISTDVETMKRRADAADADPRISARVAGALRAM